MPTSPRRTAARIAATVALLVASAHVAPPAQAAPPAQERVTWQQVVDWTYAYADKYGADPEDMLRIARCESRGNPYAIGALGEVGPYQMHPRGIWTSSPQAKAGYSIYDTEATVASAAWVYSRGWAYTTLGWYWCANNAW